MMPTGPRRAPRRCCVHFPTLGAAVEIDPATNQAHGWLLVHIPLSYALLVLGAWHAVVAVRF